MTTDTESPTTATATHESLPKSYATLMADGAYQEREGRLAAALESYDDAISRHRKQKLSVKDASVAFNRVVAEVRLEAARRGVPLDDTSDPHDLAAELEKKHAPRGREPVYVVEEPILPPAVEPTADKETTVKKPKTKTVTTLDGPGREARLAKETERAKKNKLRVGTTLVHAVRGFVQAELLYKAPGVWVYAKTDYPSISDAANAHARDMKSKSQSLNGWLYWGVEKRS